jgi:hypothetical protein
MRARVFTAKVESQISPVMLAAVNPGVTPTFNASPLTAEPLHAFVKGWRDCRRFRDVGHFREGLAPFSVQVSGAAACETSTQRRAASAGKQDLPRAADANRRPLILRLALPCT